MISLGLWKTTDNVEYLEKAEHCLINHVFANQYQTGDFGHRIIDQSMGYGLDKEIARSWWCCNFHALRALHETKEIIFSRKDNDIRFNLFFAGEFTNNDIHLTAEQINNQSNRFKIHILKVGKNSHFAVRIPGWAARVKLSFEGKSLPASKKGDYMVLDKILQTGDQIDVELDYNLKWVDKEQREIAFPFSGKINAALFYGPYLMSVDSNFQPFFDAEPSLSNYIELEDELKLASEMAPSFSHLKNTYLLMKHFHTDMFGTHPVVMRPICETTWQPPCNIRVWFTINH